METPLQRARRVATRDLNARTTAAVARHAVPAARKKKAAIKIQSKVRANTAKNKASNARIPAQLTALSNRVSQLIPKDLNKTVSRFLVKPAGKTKKANKNKKGGMSCGSHVPKKSKRAGKTKRKRNNKFR